MATAVARWLAAGLILGASAGIAAWPATDYVVSSELSSATFTVYKWAVLKEQGRFRHVSGRIHYDPAHPETSRVDVTIQTDSIDTNDGGRDGVLRSDDFFDVARYPTMRFVSRTVGRQSERALAVRGDLTIHGVTKSIEFVAIENGVSDVEHVGRLAGFEATFHIDRTDFGVNGSRWSGGKLLISRDVEIHLAIAAADRPVYSRSEP